jgi:phage head maturation protease
MKVDFIDRGGRPVVVAGYAATFHHNSYAGRDELPAADWTTRIAFGAFEKALAMPHTINCLVNHENQLWPLGSSRDGSLRLWTDHWGLAFEVTNLAVTPQNASLLVEISKGDCRCSFAGFHSSRDDHETRRRIIENFDFLHEISILAWGASPGFPGTPVWLGHQGLYDVRAEVQKPMALHLSGREFGLARVAACRSAAAVLAKPPAPRSRAIQAGRIRH